MKKHFLFISAILLSEMQSSAQSCYWLTFETQDYTQYIWLDTTHSNNIWQVGAPQKNIFIAGCNSSQRALVTDTTNPYPINDTSSFYLLAKGSCLCCAYIVLYFDYQTNTDTLKDYGFIEYSVNGGNWYNLTDTLYKLGLLNSPILSGTTNGCKFFSCNISTLFNIYYAYGDTNIVFKFTFISDSVQTNKDGWMIDDLSVLMVIDVPEINSLSANSCPFPNPATNVVTIDIEATNVLPIELTVTDYFGRKIYEEKNIKEQTIEIETKNFNSGIYFYKLTNAITYQSGGGKFIVTK